MNENKTNINWLACIYAVHHLSPYKMVVFKNWDLASFNKKRRKIRKNRVKNAHFWEDLGYWLVICRQLFWRIFYINIFDVAISNPIINDLKLDGIILNFVFFML